MDSMKILKRILMYATHLGTNIMIQAALLGLLSHGLVGDSHNPIADTFGCVVTALFFLIADYAINSAIIRKTDIILKSEQLFHLLDLILIVPYLWASGKDFFILRLYGAELAKHIIVLGIIALLITERIVLIRKTDFPEKNQKFEISILYICGVVAICSELTLFGIVRVVLCSLALAACVYFAGKVFASRKWYLRAALCIMVILLTRLSFSIPIENAFVTFSSPESAYRYIGKGETRLVVNGQETTFVIGGNGSIYKILPKTDSGWKFSMGLKAVYLGTLEESGNYIEVYQYKDSDDYYIVVSDVHGYGCEITDNRNSQFYRIGVYPYIKNKNDDVMLWTARKYCAYVQGLDDDYILTVNGEQVSVLLG